MCKVATKLCKLDKSGYRGTSSSGPEAILICLRKSAAESKFKRRELHTDGRVQAKHLCDWRAPGIPLRHT